MFGASYCRKVFLMYSSDGCRKFKICKWVRGLFVIKGPYKPEIRISTWKWKGMFAFFAIVWVAGFKICLISGFKKQFDN